MKAKDLEEARRLLRAALGASYQVHNLRIAINKFTTLDDNNEIHVREEDTLAMEQIEEYIEEALNTCLSIIDEELPAVLGVNLIDREGEISICREFREYRAKQIVGSQRNREAA